MKIFQLLIVSVFICMTLLDNAFANGQIHPMSELSKNSNNLVKKGSPNYGQYGLANKRTNPLRYDNPYNALNDKLITTAPAQNYNGRAVTFKKSRDGKLYGYDKYGKKVGVYQVNKNGTTSQFSTRGQKVGTYR